MLSYSLSEKLVSKYLLTENAELSSKALKTLLCLSLSLWTELETWTKMGEGGVQGLDRQGDWAEETLEITGEITGRAEQEAMRSLRNTNCECQGIILR